MKKIELFFIKRFIILHRSNKSNNNPPSILKGYNCEVKISTLQYTYTNFKELIIYIPFFLKILIYQNTNIFIYFDILSEKKLFHILNNL